MSISKTEENDEKFLQASPKASPEKAWRPEKLSNIERQHQPDTSFVCPSNTTKINTISLTIYIVYIIVTSLCFN